MPDRERHARAQLRVRRERIRRRDRGHGRCETRTLKAAHVSGLNFPIKYVGRPVKFPDPALSPSGLQSNLVRQDVLLQRAAYVTGRLKDGGTGEIITKDNAQAVLDFANNGTR